MYAAGKIPGSFFRREGRPGETAILTARLIDRPLRPTFKEGFRDEVQVICTILSVDMANPYDIPAMNAAACAVALAGLPFDGPVAAVRLGMIDGRVGRQPDVPRARGRDLRHRRRRRQERAGGVDILMIEGEAPDNTWPLLATGEAPSRRPRRSSRRASRSRRREIGQLIAFQEEFIDAHGVTPMEFTPSPLYGQDIWDTLYANFAGKLEAAIVPDKQAARCRPSMRSRKRRSSTSRRCWARRSTERDREFSARVEEPPEEGHAPRVIDQGVRLDGRGPKDIRPLSAEVGVVPRAHGSALFERGDTQVLNVTTLGMLRDDAADRHARSRGLEALHAPLQLPAVLHRRDRPRRLAPAP